MTITNDIPASVAGSNDASGTVQVHASGVSLYNLNIANTYGKVRHGRPFAPPAAAAPARTLTAHVTFSLRALIPHVTGAFRSLWTRCVSRHGALKCRHYVLRSKHRLRRSRSVYRPANLLHMDVRLPVTSKLFSLRCTFYFH